MTDFELIIYLMGENGLKHDDRFMTIFNNWDNGIKQFIVRMGKYDLVKNNRERGFTLFDYYNPTNRRVTGDNLIRYKWNKMVEEVTAKQDGIDLLNNKL